MSFKPSQLEELVAWCSTFQELADIRKDARRNFFGEDDPHPVRYWPGAADATAKQRRFMGWFMFHFALPDGRSPAEFAAERLYKGQDLEGVLKAVRGHRYVLAVITSAIPGQGLFLELEDERFEVQSKALSRMFSRGTALVIHLVPSRPGLWLPGPGWMEWPTVLGPNIRKALKRVQPDPISVERLLQMRSTGVTGPAPGEHPKDATLEQAVARMTEAAEAKGKTALVMSVEEWRALVLKHLNNSDMAAFSQEVIRRVGNVESIEELNRFLSLATNIWNATPQPDRGGRTAYELLEEEKRGWELR